MKLLPLFLLLSLPAAAGVVCPVSGLKQVLLPEGLSCEAFQGNFALARRMVLKRKWATEAQLDAVWSQVTVEVVSWESFQCGDVAGAIGCTYVGRRIQLAVDGSGLLHELLHVLEGCQGHEHWEERGWARAANSTFPKRRMPL